MARYIKITTNGSFLCRNSLAGPYCYISEQVEYKFVLM